MAPWSDSQDCKRDHSFCTQLADLGAEVERLRAVLVSMRREMLEEGTRGWPNEILDALASPDAEREK